MYQLLIIFCASRMMTQMIKHIISIPHQFRQNNFAEASEAIIFSSFYIG